MLESGDSSRVIKTRRQNKLGAFSWLERTRLKSSKCVESNCIVAEPRLSQIDRRRSDFSGKYFFIEP